MCLLRSIHRLGAKGDYDLPFQGVQLFVRVPNTKSYLRLLIDLTLVVLTLIGGYLALQSGRQRASLSSQIARIEKRLGSFPISDPKLVHIQDIETDDPYEFQWRIYLPANYRLNRVLETAGSSTTSYAGLSGSNPSEIIARVQFRITNGIVECFGSFGNSTTMMGLRRQIEVAAMKEKMEQLEIERLGRDRCLTLQPDEEFTLMKISIPKELLQSLKVRFPESDMPEQSDCIFRVKFQRPSP